MLGGGHGDTLDGNREHGCRDSSWKVVVKTFQQTSCETFGTRSSSGYQWIILLGEKQKKDLARSCCDVLVRQSMTFS